MLVSPVTFNRLVLSSSSSSRTETPPLALDNYSLNKKKFTEFVVSATPSKGGGNLWRRKRQQRKNEDISGGYGSESEENEIAASGVVGHAVLAKIRGADLKEKGTTTTTITTPRTAKSKKAVPSSTTRTTTTSLSGSDVLMALLNSSNKTSNKKRRKGTRSTSYTKRGDDYSSSSEDEDEENEENNSLMKPLHIKKEWGSKLDELGRSLEELVRLHNSR